MFFLFDFFLSARIFFVCRFFSSFPIQHPPLPFLPLLVAILNPPATPYLTHICCHHLLLSYLVPCRYIGYGVVVYMMYIPSSLWFPSYFDFPNFPLSFLGFLHALRFQQICNLKFHTNLHESKTINHSCEDFFIHMVLSHLYYF